MNKYIMGGIVGVCVAITVLSVWNVFSMRSRVTNLETFAGQVTNIINNSQQQAVKK
ncbi:MAG: hypothetical protein V4469_04585 [Patescibacteria group bacterium]